MAGTIIVDRAGHEIGRLVRIAQTKNFSVTHRKGKEEAAENREREAAFITNLVRKWLYSLSVRRSTAAALLCA
jgi:hypothetical protein